MSNSAPPKRCTPAGRCLCWLAALCVLSPAVLADPLPDWARKVHRAAPPAEMVQTLLDGLGDPHWAVRDGATRWLSLGGPELYEPLLAVYRQTLSQEVRFRIRQITREVFIRHRLGSSGGFIGIRMLGVRAIGAGIIGDGPGVGIRIRPMANTAATEAGLQSDDLIVMLDHRLLDGSSGNALAVSVEFAQRIGQHPPGHTVNLTVLRGRRLHTVEVTLMPRPISMEKASVAYHNAKEDFRYFWNERLASEPPADRPTTSPTAGKPD